MSSTTSPNTQAILLLTSPLLAGGGQVPGQLYGAAEYLRLARGLHDQGFAPHDLLAANADEVITTCFPEEAARLRALLGRGLVLAEALRKWSSVGIEVISRADEHYPRRLQNRLKEMGAHRPPVVFCIGNRALAENGGLAMVGSRDASKSDLEWTAAVAVHRVEQGGQVVSGGARGVDQAAMLAALGHGGQCVGFLADGLSKARRAGKYRNHLKEGNLLLLSAADPDVGFKPWRAMERNKYVYAIAEEAVVVQSAQKGGTWEGVTEQLKMEGRCPVFLRPDASSGGLKALNLIGAQWWPSERLPKGMVQEPARGGLPSAPLEDGQLILKSSIIDRLKSGGHIDAKGMRVTDIQKAVNFPGTRKALTSILKALIDDGALRKMSNGKYRVIGSPISLIPPPSLFD